MNRIIKRILFVSLGLFGIVLLITSSPGSIDELYDINFLEEGCIIHHSGLHYLTCKELSVKINNDVIVIPNEFDTNSPSIPTWYPSSAQTSQIAFPIVLHDYLYQCPGIVPRETIDLIFYYAMLKNDVSKYDAYKLWLGAKLFGAHAFNQGQHCNRQDYVEDYESYNSNEDD